MIKNFVLDTNVLLQSNSHTILNGFSDNNVIITWTTLQELDAKKTAGGEVGYSARVVIRQLEELRKKGNLQDGIELDSGGRLYVVAGKSDKIKLPQEFNSDTPDNKIIATCIGLNRNKTFGSDVILVTNDISMRVSASVLGLEVQEYKNEVVEDTDYKGHKTVEADKDLIDQIYHEKEVPFTLETRENEFITLVNGSQSALTIYRDGKLHLIPAQRTFGNVQPLNKMQSYAMYALRAPAEEIPLVILVGSAGTAKTFLSLAAGLEYTYTSQRGCGERYNKVLLSRPMGIGFSNIGFLPGDLDRKLSPLMASYYDNMEILLSGNEKESRDQIMTQMDDMLEDGVVEVCSLDFIRGRSLQDTYIICDEAQNASRGLIRDLVTRAGKGSKVVLAGDPGQIDVPSLDKRTNGLVYAASAMAGSSTTALITFEAIHSVRSRLAKDAIERMNF